MEEEKYLGGFVSYDLLMKKKIGYKRGFGIYATDKRIIVVKSSKSFYAVIAPALVGSVLVGGVIGAIVANKLGYKLDRDENVKAIKELDENKDFEIIKEQISTIEIKNPRMRFGMGHSGHLTIKSKSGETLDINITGDKEFEMTLELMQVFFPEAVKVID